MGLNHLKRLRGRRGGCVTRCGNLWGELVRGNGAAAPPHREVEALPPRFLGGGGKWDPLPGRILGLCVRYSSVLGEMG